jgi:hypothetical protein
VATTRCFRQGLARLDAVLGFTLTARSSSVIERRPRRAFLYSSRRVITRPVATMSRATLLKLVQVMNELRAAFGERLIEDATVHRPERFSEPLHNGLLRWPHIST